MDRTMGRKIGVSVLSSAPSWGGGKDPLLSLMPKRKNISGLV